ncbi:MULTISPECIES: SRPBCC family protein [Anaeromyxobacter]|uniref:SRPBCC family protein n=1 Tax=Anaeromyxobacter TaxID=161492 RepID=UPI001F5638DB|nr:MULTISPECIES: SRPBCC family protein [unclassified Anaeromyxobacter]
MERIEKKILVEVEAARVFDYLHDPRNLLEIWPSLVEVTNVQLKEGGGADWDWTYKMAGLRFHGRSETVEAVRPRRFVTKNEKGIPSTFTWTLEQRDAGTEVVLKIQYELPLPLLGHVAELFLRHSNEREAETLLENLKERLESAGASPRAPEMAPPSRQPPPTLPHA